MCEFISYLEVTTGGKTHLLYLDDAAISSDHGKEWLEGCKDNDKLGHTAIRNFWGPKANGGIQHELRNFWETNNLPKELQEKLRDFPALEKHFGKMLGEFAQEDDLQYILANAPDTAEWKGLKPFCNAIIAKRKQDRIPHLLRVVTQEKLSLALTDDSMSELIAKGNKKRKYNYVNPNITDANFKGKASGTGKMEVILLHFPNEVVETEEVEAVAKELGLTLGTSKDGGHLGAQHPKEQETNWLVCLGDSWRDSGGRPRVVVLYDSAGYRELDLYCRAFRWHGIYRFLAFRKSSSGN